MAMARTYLTVFGSGAPAVRRHCAMVKSPAFKQSPYR